MQSNESSLASLHLATKIMEDSSAMKTIAVMTMLFLPGTFSAALFAMPLFQWTESKVIQKSFLDILGFHDSCNCSSLYCLERVDKLAEIL